MKIIPSAHELIANMRAFFQLSNSKLNYLNEEPLRAELFSSDQMEHFGKSLAHSHKLSKKPAKDYLLKRLAKNEVILYEVRKLLADSIKRKYQITPAGEWLIDNFYLIEEHIRNAKKHFPKDYSEDLPQLSGGVSAGQTRVYDIVLQIISHSDGRIDIESLSRFVKAYQTVTYLKLGELWAIPIMLRLALIENLRRVSARIAIDRVDGNLADYWAKQMIETAEKDPKNLILVVADMARSNPPMVSAFVSELTRQLRGKGPDLALALNWIEQQLSEIGMTSAELISAEIQKQAADQVSMSNSIGSLRLLGEMDWRDFVETHSIVEQTLREDDEGVYGLMDFATRDRYRHVVEYIARKSRASEFEVARIAIRLSQEKKHETTNDSESHVGYYLIGKGVSQTKRLANMRISLIEKVQHVCRKYAFPIYLFFVLVITLLISAGIMMKAYADTKNIPLLILIALLSILCTSQLAISLVNFFSTLLVKPHLLPRMNFSHTIPSRFRTLVVIPVMLTDQEEIESLAESLEVRFLANRNANLHFGLLTDFSDAPQEKLPGDRALIDTMQKRIETLNKKYGKENNDLFFLFHRPRHWNPKENVWMGYERKRGKLSELNSLLRGSGEERFSLIIGNKSIFPSIKYVITLDADTQLPLGTAWKLIGAMAHPLNHPWYDEKKKRVTKGYGILQPRVAVSLPDTTASLYARMHGNQPGIDPYTRASSDVYQDLFAEGSFIGKGIYDVDIFKKVLDGRFAENCILSHDLLEGSYVRAGLLSDVQLFEKYPDTYRADMKRRARWVRGDWQIFSWFLPFVPDAKRHWHKNPVSGLSRWKIFDNIRRSLVPLALTTLLLLGWIVLPSSLLWTIIVSCIVIAPIFISSVWDTIKKPKDVILMHHIKNSIHNIYDVSSKTLFTLVCLPNEALSNLAAILRALWRMLISRRKMLEWNPSAYDGLFNRNSLPASYSFMWPEFVLVIIASAYCAVFLPEKLAITSPILFLWLTAPFVTWWISKPQKKQASVLSSDQIIFLRKMARKTWGFFERFVVPEDNFLPPDNFQEQPEMQIAHRTSPTNIGLSLLSNISAYDFGYITVSQLTGRVTKTIASLKKMERYKGHFYNWYDTQTLHPLLPKYISTVDSGNLVGSLLVLKQGLLAISHQKVQTEILFTGLRDTLYVLSDTLDKKGNELIMEFRTELELICNSAPIACHEVKPYLNKLNAAFLTLSKHLLIDAKEESYWWKEMLEQQMEMLNENAKIFAPWLALAEAPPEAIDFSMFSENLTLVELFHRAKKLQAEIRTPAHAENLHEKNDWHSAFLNALNEFIGIAEERIRTLEDLARDCNELSELEWDFLYDKQRNLFTIGYSVQEHKMDSSFYDLLASEARLCSFIGIAQGKLPEESWFALGRLLTNVDNNPILLSWSGSMFEYLMPLLIMPDYENTLLGQTCRAAVKWQIEYGKQTGLPWGISESGYNMINTNSNYQYRAFGAPGLGLKRGLEEDSVIAPYASVLALMIAPEKACANLELLSEKGLQGKYGFYEAVDFTPSRLQRDQSSAIVYSFMAHHQGMSMLSFANLLLDQPMQKLFESEPQFKGALLLLQERIPKASTFYAHTTDIADINYAPGGTEIRTITTPDTPTPQVQLLSNGRYNVMVTNAGGGYSRWKDLAVTRWREDTTCDNWGTFCYIRDVENETFWSNTYQPTLEKGENYEAVFSQGRVDFRIIKNELETHTVIAVSPEDDIEIRRVSITNHSAKRRTIEVTSYAEVVLAHPASDLMQPAFSNLFVQTEIIPLQHSILCTRRPRSADEQPPWLFHLMSVHGKNTEEISYETDRMKFIGRGNSIMSPDMMNDNGLLSGHQGSVLDPIVSIRYKIILEPEEIVSLDMVIGITETKDACLNLIDKYQDKHHLDRVFELSWTHSQVVLRQINASEADAQLYCRLASSILFATSSSRADVSILINNHRGQSGLWGYSVSGDLPIVLLKIEKHSNMQLIRQMIQAHSYWRLKGLPVDLVIWNEEHDGYRQAFQNEIEALIPVELKDRPGGIFARLSDHMSNEDRILFQAVARVTLTDNGGKLVDYIKTKMPPKVVIPYHTPVPKQTFSNKPLALPQDLLFFNGSGGFSSDGREYVIKIDSKNKTPVPWVNVIANPGSGTVVSESGTAYTWIENAHELRLTPWNNDPVCDSGGEAFYLRDEDSGNFWSTTLLPAGSADPYITRHGFGYSIFEHATDGIYSEMKEYMDIHSPVKFIVLKIRNQSGKARKLSLTGYVEWVLGDYRMKTAMHTRTEIDPESGAVLAKNTYNTEFNSRVAFFDADYTKRTFTADRTEFIGRNGTLKNPDAMHRQKLSGKVGLALDPCGAIQIPFELADGQEQEIIFRLGAGKDQNEASELVRHFRGSEVARDSFEKMKNYWQHTIGALQVETPDTALNIITNGWLSYQTLSSRLWGRSGFYQSGGAFGFRDQLQDVLSLLHVAPEFARKQILLSASRQFREGDVQHWWHPPSGRGVRTRCSDDFLWLPFVTAQYVLQTGDIAVLEENIPFLEGRLLNPSEESYYDLPVESVTTAKLYGHCVAALKNGFRYGEHGLPLIGTGDWNDGYDRVGEEGKGESVWLAFFLYETLRHFEKLARQQEDNAFADECIKQAQGLKENIHKHAWDGKWYTRAWFDDGTPLGSSSDEECKIDSIAQSWSVLSDAGDNERNITAMNSAFQQLVDTDAGVIKLLDPPFDKSDLNPGYIKGYVPGVRENGGQYTHAAVWLIMAYAKMGENKRVWELLKMINPINHAKTPETLSIYKVEPYVLAADVYACEPHTGRGGWTWYTGSAGWLYRLITESFLGLKQEGNKLMFVPCIPEEWESFKLYYRYKTAAYEIEVSQKNVSGEMEISVDGKIQADKMITLENDGTKHKVEITLFAKSRENG